MTLPRRSALSVLCALAIGGLTACDGGGGKPRPVLFVTIDTLRADAIGVIGGGTHTPTLDALATEGVLFDDAVSVTPITGPSHASMLSGLYPYHHGVRNNGQGVPADTPLVAQILHEKGFATGGFISGFPLDGMFGFGRGFDHYDDAFDASSASALAERSAEATTKAALQWIEGQGARPWFGWVHYYDPHTPYTAPAAYAQQGPRAEYLAEVAYVDHWLGELVRAARRVSPDVVVIVTSDHGEGLGDHGEVDHGLLLYQSTLRVPLIIHAQGGDFTPRLLATPVRSVDIAPTLLGIAGVDVPRATPMDGVDLAPLLHGGTLEVPPAYSETFFGAVTYGWAPLRALREGAVKRVEGAHARVFDLSAHPDEIRPMGEDEAAAPGSRLESLLATVPAAPPAASAPADGDAIAKLRSLGYLGAGTTVDADRWDADIDPEDMLPEHNQILRAQNELDTGNLAMAEGRFKAILSLSPSNRVAWLRLGSLQASQRRLVEAADSFMRAVTLDPHNTEARYQYGQILMELRRFRDAAIQWAEVTRDQPERAVAWSNLGTSLLFDGQHDAAIEALSRAVSLAPQAADLRENLVRAQMKAGDTKGAIDSLEALAGLQGDAFELAAVQARLLADQGDVASAERSLVRARPGQEDFAGAHLALALRLAASRPDAAATHLRSAIDADPRLRSAAESDPELAPLLERD